MSIEATVLPFWEHPDTHQLMEFLCCKCLGTFYLTRTKDQPYPYQVPCKYLNCEDGVALPTQEKQDWLRRLKKSNASDSSPEKPNPSTG